MSKPNLEHSRSEMWQREDLASSGLAPKLSLPTSDLKGRSLTAAPPPKSDGARIAPVDRHKAPRRMSHSDMTLQKRSESKDWRDAAKEGRLHVRVLEAEVKDVLDPLVYKVKFDGGAYSSSVSASGKWTDGWTSNKHKKETLRISLWTVPKGKEAVKYAVADVSLPAVWTGTKVDDWIALKGLDGKPLAAVRLHVQIMADEPYSDHEDLLVTAATAATSDDDSSNGGALVRRSPATPTLTVAGTPPKDFDPRRASLAAPSPLLGGMQLRRDTSAIRAMLQGRPAPALEREAQFRRFFELPESDLLVGDWSAAFMKGVARHGRLFVFTDHLCFHSNLFGVKTVFSIPFVDVIGIEKTVESLTPGIRVRTNDKTFNFGGIYARVKCHEMISSIWRGSYVMVDGENTAALAESGTVDAEEKMMEEQFPAELFSNRDYEKDGFLGGVDELTELLQDDLPVTPTRFFQLFVSDESGFEHDYHVQRGDTNVKVEPWSPHETFGTTRNVSYTLKLTGPVGPPTTRTEEVHRYHLTKDRLIIDTSMNMLDAPYGDYFRVESQWVIATSTEGASHIKISAKAVFMKSTIMKGTISSRTLAGMTESFQFWLKQAREVMAKKQSSASPSKNGGSGDKAVAATADAGASAPVSHSGGAQRSGSAAEGNGVLGTLVTVATSGAGLVGSLLDREVLSRTAMLLHVVIQVLIVYVLLEIIKKL